jgi:predicted dehydrogenase
MDRVRVGIVGIGGMGSSHARYIASGEVPGAELVAVADVSGERLERARRNFGEGLKTFETAEAMYDSGEVDGVLIATTHYDHPPLAIKGFERGLHVLCEKPAGVYTKQVREMNEAARRSGKVFALMFNQRMRPVHRKMKDMMDSGDVGELRRSNWIITSWFRAQCYYDSGGWRATWAGEGGGVLLNQCPHNLDLWQWICGMPKRVRAFCYFGQCHDIEVEDDVTAFVEYEDKATGVFITSTGEAPGTNRFEIAGDNGKLVLEDGRLTFWRTRVPVSRFNREYKGGFGGPEVWRCEIPTGGPGEEHKGVTKNWVAAILEGAPLLSPGEEGIRSLELSNAMLLSSWKDDWVNLPIDEDEFHRLLQERIESSTFRKKAAPERILDTGGTY